MLLAYVSIFRFFGFFTEPALTGEQIHAVVAESSEPAPPTTPARPVIVVSWNIDRGSRFDAIASTLQRLEPDVVLLQEVDRFCRRSGDRDVGRDLAERLRMHWVSAGEFQEVGESRGGVPALTGQTILSRYPITDAEAIVFTNQITVRWRIDPLQPRRGGRIALRARTAGIVFYDLHLESIWGRDSLRQQQLEQVLADETHHGDPIVFGGDFNNTLSGTTGLVTRCRESGLLDALAAARERRTSVHYEHPIDWVFAKGLHAIDGRVERVKHASDHDPVVATLTPLELRTAWNAK
jgi:endonuclease/exonuclease/phosphatase family metal-dependent hydrolase